jgi:DNA-binding NarL/FixJ family response regulator
VSDQVRVVVLEDHQSIIDGYSYRLAQNPEIQVVGSALHGEDLEALLSEHPADVLLLDVNIPTSSTNHNPYPVLSVVSTLLKTYPKLSILAISMLTQHTLVSSLVEAGVSGYIFKEDQVSIQQLPKIVTMVAKGGIYFSPEAYEKLRGRKPHRKEFSLTTRQLQVISLCAAFPDSSTAELAKRLKISSSTMRNLLSGAYNRLEVRTRAAAIAKVQQMGMIPSTPKGRGR